MGELLLILARKKALHIMDKIMRYNTVIIFINITTCKVLTLIKTHVHA